ncbi:MAG: peptidase S41, partial [Bacteroidales bacterium]|nr:peptidase S41 [Candidatus Sodaliphilus fimicaballi]
SRDSIKIDKSQIFTTQHGRKVYGGGGIVPDIFVPRDTTGISSYYIEVANAGLIQQFAFKYVDVNRKTLSQMKDYKQFLRMEPAADVILNDFVNYASQHGVPARWYYINQSRDIIVNYIKALVARDIFGNESFYPIINRNDKTVEAALKAFNKHRAAFPITSDK